MAKKQSKVELLEEIREQFTLAKRYLDPIHKKMNDQESLYRTYLDGDYPHTARVFDPRVFRVIETITPRMVANEPTGSFYPSEEGDIDTSEILNSLIKYDWNKAHMFPKLTSFVKSMLIFGTAFGLNHWDFRETTKKRMVPKELNGSFVWSPTSSEEVTVTEFDGPNFEPLNIYDCFPDPNCTSVDNMRWFIYRTFKTIKELKEENDTRGFDYYTNLDKLETAIGDKASKSAKSANTEDSTYREHRRTMLSTEELKGQDKSNPDVVILRRFTKDRWVEIAPEYDLVIREIDNPYFHGEIPIVVGVDYPYPGELYGMGEIEPIDRIQRAINAVLNQRLDNVQLVLRNMWKVRKNSGVDMHTLISAPGNIVTTDDMNAVESIDTPDVTGPSFVQTMNYLTAALQNGSGITDYTIGINNESSVANKTATGTRLIQQEANAQFKLKIQLFYHMVVERVANQWKDLRIQFTTEGQKLRIVGKEKIQSMVQNTNLSKMDMQGNPIVPGDLEAVSKLTISPDQEFAFLSVMPEDIQPAIVGDYDFIATVSSEALSDPVTLQENFFAGMDRVSTPIWIQGLASQGSSLDYVHLTEKVFEKLNIGIESSQVLTEAPQPQAPPVAPGGEQGQMQSQNMGQVPPANPAQSQPNAPLNISSMQGPHGNR